ncbi:MAG TPA: hypothetical protein VHC23_07295 [Jatrophihabitans sp.]|nr:hypothetical protein [Jatrophihabitans sp.]
MTRPEHSHRQRSHRRGGRPRRYPFPRAAGAVGTACLTLGLTLMLGAASSASAATKTVATARLVQSSGAPVSFAAVSPAKKKGSTISFGASAPSRAGDARITLTGSLRVTRAKRSASFTRLRLQPASGGATLVAQSAGKWLALLSLKARKGKPVRISARAGTVRIDAATARLAVAAASRIKSALRLSKAPSTTRSIGSVTLVIAAEEEPSKKPGAGGGATQNQAASGAPVKNGTGAEDSPQAAAGLASATLTWNLAHESGPSTGTLSNYAAGPIGQQGGAGSVVASGGASGGPITNVAGAASPAAGAQGSGVKVPFGFPIVAGAPGSIDPATRAGTINFSGALTVTAHGQTFWTVVNPTLSFDSPSSIRLIASGVVPSGGIGSTDPPTPYGTGPGRQTVFAFDGAAATWSGSGNGPWTVGNLVPVDTGGSFLSADGVFDPLRAWFATSRANQLFSVTFTLSG